MKCYKVVQKYTYNYLSCRIEYGTRYALEYNVDEWTAARPDTIGICTFDTLEHARAFISETGSFLRDVIFLAEGNGKRRSRFIGNYLNHLSHFYRRKKSKHASDGCLPPEGTLFFERVMLLEEVRR